MSEQTDPKPQGFIPLEPAFEAQAIAMLEPCAAFRGYANGEAFLRAAQADDETDLMTVTVNDTLAILIVTKRVPMMNELLALVVDPAYRGHDLGKLALIDAVQRAGRRPLIVECDDAARPYFLKQGFKMVGKRKGPDGEFRIRMGAHAPRPEGEPDPLGRNGGQA